MVAARFFSPEPDEIDSFDGCHMLEHHLQAGKALDHRPQGLDDEHRLAIEDVDVWVRGFAVDQQRHAGFFHPAQHPVNMGDVGDAVGGMGGRIRRIELGRRERARLVATG